MIKRDQLALMKKRAVLVDVSIDQGGCFETSRPTTHSDPVFDVDGVTHYCVANMPGAVPVTSTFALTNATLPYVLELADHGVKGAIARDPGLRPGVNVAAGKVTHPAVAEGVGGHVHAGRGRAGRRPDRLRRSHMATATITLQNFIDGELVDASSGADRGGDQPGHRRGDRRACRSRLRRTWTGRWRRPSGPSRAGRPRRRASAPSRC